MCFPLAIVSNVPADCTAPSTVPQVVCYIYFTRIIVYLLESTLPYHYIWLAAASSEVATLAFYVAAGVSFRCAGCLLASRLAPLLARLHQTSLVPLECWSCVCWSCELWRQRSPDAPALLPTYLAWPLFPACCACRPMPAGANPYFQLTEEEAIELTKAEQEENP